MHHSPYRYHPLAVFFLLQQYFLLLLAPLVRPAFYWVHRFFAPTFAPPPKGTLLFTQEIALLCFILGYGYFLWRTATWQFAPQKRKDQPIILQLESGVFLQKTTYIACTQLGSIQRSSPLPLRLMGACLVTLQYKNPTIAAKNNAVHLLLSPQDATMLCTILWDAQNKTFDKISK